MIDLILKLAVGLGGPELYIRFLGSPLLRTKWREFNLRSSQPIAISQMASLLRSLRPTLLRPIMAARYASFEAPLIISPAQLHQNFKENQHVAILDTTWFMPNSPRKAYDEFQKRRLPGAQFLDLDKVLI